MELPDSMDFAEPQDPKPAQPPAPPLAPTPLPVQQVVSPVVEPPQGTDAQQQADLESLLQTNQRMMQRDEQQQQAALMEQFRLAVEQDPDMLAQQQQMAREMGVEPETAAQNWEFVQRFQKQQQLRRAAEDARYPIVAEGMRTKNYAALTQDDIANLQRLEGFWSTAGAGWTMGDLTVERGYIGAKMASGYADIDDINRLREIDRQLRQLPKPQTVMQGIASGTLELAGQMKTTLPTAAAGGALLAAPAMAGTPYSAAAAFSYGFTATMFAQSAMIEGGNAYADYIERGFSEEDARTAAFGVGLLNGALEVVGFKYASMPARKLLAKAVGKSATDAFRDQTVQSAYSNVAKSVAKSVGPEVLTEMAQETITIAGGEWAKAQSRPELDQRFGSWEGIKGVAGEVYEVGVKTLESMVLLGMVPAVGTAMTDAKRIDQAKVTQQVLQGAINGTLDTKTLERAPDVLRSLVEQATQGKMDTLYISGKTLLDVLRKHDADVTASGKGYFKSARDQLAELFPDQIAKLDDAAANGYDLQFTTADISVKLAQKTGISQALLPHFRSDESGLSYAEAAAYEPELKKLVGQMEPQISEKAQADKKFSDSAREVRDGVYQQLVETGMPVDRARVGAELARRRAMLMAPGRQMLPKQWFDQYGFQVMPAKPQDVVLPPIPIPTRLQQPIVQPPVAPAPAPAAPAAAAAPEAAPAQAAIAPSRYDDAVNLVLGQRKASPEFLQRNMAISYTEANQLLAQMEADQLIGEAVGPRRARQVIMSLAQYRRMRPVQPATEAQAPVAETVTAPAEAVAPKVAPTQPVTLTRTEQVVAALTEPGSTLTQEQQQELVLELLNDPAAALTEDERAPLQQWLEQAQQVLFSRMPTTAAITESNVEQIVADNLEGVPRKGEWRDVSNAIDPKTHGHCYVAAEAAYFLLGGKEAGWQPKYLNNASWPDGLDAGQTHHFLQHKETGRVIDPTRAQFGNVVIPYDQGKPQAWVTNKKKATESPSKRAQIVIDNVAKSFGSALRSRMPTTAAKLDAEYLAAVERGDMETAQRMVDEAGDAASYPVNVWHGGSFDVAQGDEVFRPWTHFGTKAAAEERVGGSGVVDSLLKSIEVQFVEEADSSNGEGWYFSVDGYDDETAYSSEAKARAAAEQMAIQQAEAKSTYGVEGSFTKARIRGPFIQMPDLGVWGLSDVIKHLPPYANLSAQEKDQVFELSRSGKLGDDWAKLADILVSKGFNGIQYINKVEDKGSNSYIVFRSSDVKSAEPVTRDASGNVIPLSQRFDLTKDSILFSQQPEGDVGGTYERNTRTIRLVNAALHDPNAKFATFTHEFTHWMFDDLQRAIEDGVADDGMKADFEALVRWGSDGKLTGEQYRALPFEQQRQVSEAVAYGYEKYAFEGADPGIEFRGIMRKVRDWFIAAWKSVTTINDRYKQETGQNLPGLTPEVRQAFDRMLGARNQVEMAKVSRGAVALFQTKEEFIASGNSESDWEEYQQTQAERDQQFIDELIRESLQSLKWFSDGKTRSVAKLQRVVADVRKQIEAEIRPDLAKQRIYRVRHWLSTGERMNEDGSITRVADANHKLNLQDVVGQTDAANAILGELDAALLEAKSELQRADGMMVPELPEKFEEPAPAMAPATATKQEKAAAKKARKEWNDRREAAAAEMREARIPYLEAKHAREDAIKEAQRKVRQAEAELSKARAQVGRNEQLDAREHPLAKSLSEDGTPVQAVAEMFGYDSAQQMMNDLLNMPSLDEAVRDQATRIMQEEYGDLSTPEAIDETVYRTMYNRFQQKWSTSEYRFLLKRSRVANNTAEGVEQQKDAKEALIDLDNEVQQVRSARKAAKENGDDASVKRYDQEIKDLEADRRDLEIEADGALSHRIMIAAAREAALLRLDNMALKQIKPGLFYAAARRNSREAHASMTQGKFQEALTSKRNQIGNEATGFMADRVKREVNSSMRWFKRVLRGNDKTIAKKRALDMVYAARAILVAFGIGGSEKQRAAIMANAQEYLRQLREYYPDAATRVMSLIEDATKNNKKVGDLTYQEFRRLNEAVRELWALAERARSVELGNRKIEMSEIRQQIQARAAELTKNAGVRPGVRTGVTSKQRFLSNLGNGLALMRRAESVFDKWDGAQPGVFTKILWRPIQSAVTAYRKMRVDVYQKYAALVEKMQWDGKPIEAPELNYKFENKGALLAALLHSGNLSNLTKLLLGGRQRGEEWGALDEKTGELDRSKWDMMVARLVSEGVLTQEDFDFVQGVWDILEELKPLAQRAYRKLFGDFFEEVKAQAFSIAFKDGTTKQYRGGYVPAKIDRELALDMSNKVSLDELKEDFRYAMPKTMDGFTKARMKQVTKPLMLDLSIIGQHIDDVTKFVNIQPVLADVLRVLNDTEVTAAINSVDAAAMKNIIFPWLNRVASQRPGVSGMWPAFDKVVNTVRNRVGIGIMFLNISNATQQLTGLFPALLKVRGSYMRGSMRRWSQGGLAEAVASKSEYMNNLMDKGIFEVITETNDLILQPNSYNKAVRWVNKNAYILQQKVQNLVNVIVWDAAYNQAHAELPTTMTAEEMEAEAIQRADAAVRLTQGTTQPESISQAEAGTPFFRTFTQFTSYFNTLYNLNATEFQKIVRELGFRGGSGKLFTTWLIGFAAPMIVGGAIARAFAGKFAEDEEDDDANGFLFNWVLDPLAKGAFAMIPFGGPALYSSTVGMYTDTIYDDRMMANPVVNVLERGKDAVRTSISAAADPEREVRSGRMKEMLMIGNILTGLPFSTAARPASYAYGVATDQIEPVNAADYLRGLLTGVPAEGTVNR